MNDSKQDNLFSVLSNLESNAVDFERIEHLLQVYDEFLENELKMIQKSSDPYAHHFMRRFHLFRAQLDSIQLQMHGTVKEMLAAIDIGYSIDRANKNLANCT